jgi:DNA-directed RNA polymerase specialized sigma24 family protein
MVRLRSSHYTRVRSYDHKPGALERFFPDSRPGNDPEQDLASRQVAKALRFELSRLPSCFRAPLELYYLDGLDLGGVAAQLDTTVMAVKSRLHRGRKHLRDRMMRHCGKFGGATLMAPD